MVDLEFYLKYRITNIGDTNIWRFAYKFAVGEMHTHWRCAVAREVEYVL